MSDQQAPHSIDAEMSVLGAILVQPEAIYAVGAILSPEQFFREAHRRVYAAMVGLCERGIPIDTVTLKNELQRRGDLDECGGPAYLAGLDTGFPRSTNIEYYARIVREKALLRALIDAAERVKTSAYHASGESSLVLDDAERALLAITQEATDGDLIFAEQIVPGVMAMLGQIAETKRPVSGIATGFVDLDGYTRGLHPSNLIVLGGRPGEGKSALALQIALSAARTTPVAFFSMEMSRDEILTRALAQEARVDHHVMMQGRLSDVDQRSVADARNLVEGLPIAFDDTSAITPFQIRSKAKRMQARRGLGLVVVDYIQLMQRPRHAHSREEAVGDNTWALKVLAGELRVPVLALSQLNRTSTNENRRPTMADLRESGAIEQHANVILLIYKPLAPDGSAAPPVELLISKQRNGPSGIHVDLSFLGPSMRFADVDWRNR